MNEGNCFLCGRQDSQTCPHCGLVRFCGDRHYNVHRPGEYCFPFKVSCEQGRGRFIVATRNIAPNELILIDKPIVETPYTKSKAQCLQCYKIVTGKYKCKMCGFPMCGVDCANGDLHKIECKVFEKADFEAEIDDLMVNDDHYASILPIRCLHLKYNDPEMWNRFTGFLGHCDEQKYFHKDMWDYHQ